MVQDKKVQNRTSTRLLGLVFPIRMSSAIFDLQVTPISYNAIGLSVQKKFKIDFQDGICGGHLGFPMRTNLAIIDLQVTQTLPLKFQVNWPFSTGEVQNRSSR